MVDYTSRRFVNDDISIQPWLPLSIDGHQYLLKSFFCTSETRYEVFLYDGESMVMWHELIGIKEFGLKWKEYNPNIEANLSNIIGHVETSLEDARVSSSIRMSFEVDGKIALVVKMKLKDKIPFTWKFVCFKCQPVLMKNMLVDPLLTIVDELHRQKQQLFSIIRDKDREIEDFRDQGYTTTRGSFTTLPFQKSSFTTECMVDEHFILSCQKSNVETLTYPDVSQIYRNIMINKQAHDALPLKVHVSDVPTFETANCHSVEIVPNIPSWSAEKRNPESVVFDKNEETNDISSQYSITCQNDLHDEEKLRRNAIRQRLEEDEKKSKKKKRKINI